MFVLLILLLSVICRSKAACYDTSGTERDGFFPCNTSAGVSVCCGGTDYCLDNGLCLDAFGDNIFTVQACTSATWDAPCKQYCPGLPRCGQNASCCSDSSSLITLPIFNRVFKAPGVAGDTSAPESTPSQPNESRNQALKIGLGVGLGIGLSLLAFALAFNAWELRKKNMYLKLLKDATPTTWPPHHKDLPWAQDHWGPPGELHNTTTNEVRSELHDTTVIELPGREESIRTSRGLLG
ncbi:hypothetical protein GQX73_g9038 [Xylaria multiplex]|uniref:Mid2 domain-containing protein n=1 Tax=Xylaria multiplex TaxID=323545 RepID=A0A7C8IIJ9_9PEZI|nr:hypothetical protein GQX73_g9038 [Xylaria multiplex]